MAKPCLRCAASSAVNPVYFDNAATSYPKPDGVADAVLRYIEEVGANPGRAGHSRAVEAGAIVHRARALAARLLGLANPMRVILTFNATHALNIAIQGLLREGGHAVTTSMEHNSVLRPLLAMRPAVDTTIVQGDGNGCVGPADVLRAVRPDTRLVVMSHAGNVNGRIQDVATVGAVLREHPAVFLVDAAQSAGCIPTSIEAMGADLVAFAGHKGPLGPTGTGGLLLAPHFDHALMQPLLYGGTGSYSGRTEQPDFPPDRYESGTLNVAGLAGLCVGLDWVLEQGVASIARHEEELRGRFVQGALELGITLHGSPSAPATGAVAFSLPGHSVSDDADLLSERYGILCRHGLHCAPAAHRTLGTYPNGTLRFAFGPFNTPEHIDYALGALREMLRD